MSENMTILDVKNLTASFETPDGVLNAVNGVSFSLQAGQTLGVVGESGSGKTQSFMAVLGALPDNGSVSGSAIFDGQDLLQLSKAKLNKIRGSRIAFVMQDSLSTLTPHMRVGDQMAEVLRIHKNLSNQEAEKRVLEVLELVRIPEAAQRMRAYPHELSGGMRQRINIGMALLCDPDILIADEPTTALDVTIQEQVLDIFDDLRQKTRTAIVLITHDLGVLAGRADEVMVMYGGRLMERAPVEELFSTPWHPYTEGLLKAVPQLNADVTKPLETIPGRPPDLLALPSGCPFAERCPKKQDRCVNEMPAFEDDGKRGFACHFGGAN